PAERLEAGHRAHREPVPDPGQVGRLPGGPGETPMRHEHARRAVGQDVADLRGYLVPVDRHDVQAGLDRGEVQRERGDAVGQQRRDRVPGGQAERLEPAAVAVRLAGQVRVAHLRAVRPEHPWGPPACGHFAPTGRGRSRAQSRTRSRPGQAPAVPPFGPYCLPKQKHVSLLSVDQPLRAPLEIGFDYTRSLGPVLSQFMTALARRRILGARGADGRVHAPPFEYDPVTFGPPAELVEVGPEGTVTSWSWA